MPLQTKLRHCFPEKYGRGPRNSAVILIPPRDGVKVEVATFPLGCRLQRRPGTRTAWFYSKTPQEDVQAPRLLPSNGLLMRHDQPAKCLDYVDGQAESQSEK